MQIKQHQHLTLASRGLATSTERRDGQEVVTSVVQVQPFTEIHFEKPIRPSALERKTLKVFCREVGIYQAPGNQATWTVGKWCSLER